jgi:hypothetical protein
VNARNDDGEMFDGEPAFEEFDKSIKTVEELIDSDSG